jgi:hypothetical protein
MSLADLRDRLQEQVDEHGRILVNAATMAAAHLAPRKDLDTIIRGHLALGSGELSLAFSGTVPPPSGETLTVSGAAPLLGEPGPTATVTFTAPANEAADVRVEVALPDSWRLDKAFPALGQPPFSEMLLAKNRYVVTTMPRDSYVWGGGTNPLTQGSWLFAELTLDGPLALAAALLKGGSTSDAVALSGQIDPSHLATPAAGLPTLDLSATLTGSLAVPEFSKVALTKPRIEYATAPDHNGQLSPWLAFATTISLDGEPLFDFKALADADASQVTLVVVPSDASPQKLTPGRMVEIIGFDYAHHVPPLLEEAFDAVTLRGLAVTFSLGESIELLSVEAGIGSTGTWGFGSFQIDETELAVVAQAPLGTGSTIILFNARAELFPQAIKGHFDIGLEYDVSSGDLELAGAFDGEISLSDVVHGLSEGSVSVPDNLEMKLESFGATVRKPAQGAVTYSLYGMAEGGVDLPFLGTHIAAELQLEVDSAAKSFHLLGGLQLGEAAFAVTLDLGAEKKTIKGEWKALDDAYLGLESLAEAVGMERLSIPEGLDLDLEHATIEYDVTESVLILEADSATYGKAVLAALEASGKWSFFFGLDVDRSLDLGKLPLIGPDIDEVAKVSVEQIQVLASSELDQGGAKLVNEELSQLDGKYPRVPEAGMSGVALAMVFDAGGDRTTLALATGKPSQAERTAPPAPTGTALVPAAGPPAPPSPSDGTVWITLQKSFGPVAIEKVGIRYRESVLYFLMNATVTEGALNIALLGLGLGSPLSSFKLKFTCDGLAVTFDSGPVQLSGALVGSIDPVDLYGELIIGAEQLQIGALGGYTEVEGHPSLFVYAVLDKELGGPPFFFVTGLSAGFGFNRRLAIPPVDGVAEFPLVRWSKNVGAPPMDPQEIAQGVTQAVTQLSQSGAVAPSVGDDWLALGVQFTSFELVESFALLTFEFGSLFEISLLGLSTAQLPPAPEEPVALAELELKATFVPSEGALSVLGQLTPQSFVFSRACHLSGGFALMAWFSGTYEGDFVLTLGGYGPRFQPPPHYPTVPRLGLNWKVSDQLTVSGELYFALTSSAVMAGGGLSAVWESGDISAWFDVEADFLLVFEPFHYYLSAGIHLGASFTLDLLFTSVQITVHVGVDLEIWGPEFAGRATIDLSLISFTISFNGGSPATETTIGWSEFVARLIPGTAAAPTPTSLATDPAASAPAVVQITIAKGLAKQLSDADGELNWVVNGEGVQLVARSAIPTKGWDFSPNVKLAAGAQKHNTGFGVGPVGLTEEQFVSTQKVEITATNDDEFRAQPLLGNVPAALWQKREFDEHGVPVGVDPLNSTTIEGVAVGCTLTPFTKDPDHTLRVKIEDLEYTVASPIKPFDWSPGAAPEGDRFGDETVWETIAATAPSKVRSDLLDAMKAEGRPLPTRLDLSELSSRAEYDLLADPSLRLLGEQR